MIKSGRRIIFDWITLGIYLSLLVIGFFSIYSATNSYDEPLNYFNTSSPVIKQLIYISVALLVFILVQFIDPRFWHTFAYVIYGLGIFLLLIVLVFGSEINGAKAWFVLGGFSFQPSEIAKFGTILAVCSYLTYFKVNSKTWNNQWSLLGIIFGPILLILLQPDAGSALTFLSLFILLFVEGYNPLVYIIFFILTAIFICSIIYPLSFVYFGILLINILFCSYYFNVIKYQWIIIITLIVGLLYLFIGVDPIYAYTASSIILLLELYFLWLNRNVRLAATIPFAVGLMLLFSYSSVSVFSGLKEHQQERIKVWLKPSECDPRGSLYNIIQSKVAIGSGGFFGKGFLNGNMTKLKYVPEQSTDFIFSTIGEEQGFLGSVMVIFLFGFLTWRIIEFGERSNSKFDSAFSIALAGFIIVHVLVNVGMTIGLVPIIGIPLPFISKGGTSLIMFSMMLGIFMRLQQGK